MNRTLALLSALALSSCVQVREGPPPTHQGLPSSVTVFTDPETGCEYLILYQDAITPRLSSSGAFRCRPR